MRAALKTTLMMAALIMVAACNQHPAPKATNPRVTSVTINTSGYPTDSNGVIRINAGTTTTLLATTGGEEGASQEIIWSASRKDHATITPDGVLTGLKPSGNKTTTITATSKTHHRVSDSIMILVDPEPTRATVSSVSIIATGMSNCCYSHHPLKSPASVSMGSAPFFRTHLSVTEGDISPITTITWASTNPEVLSINQHGGATTHKPGKTTITATVTDQHPDSTPVTGSYSVEVTPVLEGRIHNHNPANENTLYFQVYAHPRQDNEKVEPELNISQTTINNNGTFSLTLPSVPNLECRHQPQECFAYGAYFWAGSSNPQQGPLRNLLAEPEGNQLFLGWVYAFADTHLIDSKWPIPKEFGVPRATIPINANLKAGWNPVAVTGNLLSPRIISVEWPTKPLALHTNPN